MEHWNEKYESMLIRLPNDSIFKRYRLAKKTPKKEGYFTVFWKKGENNKNVPYSIEALVDEYIILIDEPSQGGVFIIPKDIAIKKHIVSTENSKGKIAMRFYPPWCKNLNKTARATIKSI